MRRRRRNWGDEYDGADSGRDGKRRRGGRKGAKRSGHVSRADKFEIRQYGKRRSVNSDTFLFSVNPGPKDEHALESEHSIQSEEITGVHDDPLRDIDFASD